MKVSKVLIPLILLVFAAGSATAVYAQSDWKKLGDENVNFSVDHDVINVDDDNRIRELRLSVSGGPIKFHRVVINYKGGTKQDVAYVEDVAVGAFSRTFLIEGDGQIIDSVEFWYETAGFAGKKAHVTLYGRSYMGAPSVAVAVPVTTTVPVTTIMPVSDQTGWIKLGDERVNFKVDHDKIEVDDNNRIRELRLSTSGGPVRFQRIVINYKGGAKQDVAHVEDVAVGAFSRTLMIEGDGQIIDSVEFWYETAGFAGKKAQVTLYGRSYSGPAMTPVAVAVPVTTTVAVTTDTDAGWKKLGDENVNFDTDHDVINVDDENRIRELRLNITGGPIKFRRIVINYKGGTKQDVEYIEDVAMGAFSRTFSIEGDGQIVDSVEFWYETMGFTGKKAQVTLFGRS